MGFGLSVPALVKGDGPSTEAILSPVVAQHRAEHEDTEG
jgi:hypothetical protein